MDFLKEFLGETLYEQMCEALVGKGPEGRDLVLLPDDGSFVPRAELEEALRQVEQRETEAAELIRLREQVRELSRAKVELFIEQQLDSMRVKSAAAARALLVFEEDCEDFGIIQAELDRVRRENEYLFDAEAPRFCGIVPSIGLDRQKALVRENFSHMSERERLRLMREDRPGYRRAVEQHVKKVRKVL